MNPIIQALNRNRGPNLLQLANTLRNGNPEQMFRQLMQQNPQFRQFVEATNGKTPEQIAKDYGVDLGILQDVMK